MKAVIEAERKRLEALEMALIVTRRGVGSAIVCGLDGNRDLLERRIGYIQAILTGMFERGDISESRSHAYAKIAYEEIFRTETTVRTDHGAM